MAGLLVLSPATGLLDLCILKDIQFAEAPSQVIAITLGPQHSRFPTTSHTIGKSLLHMLSWLQTVHMGIQGL